MIFAGLELSRRLERPEAFAGSRIVEARSRLSPEAGAEWIEVGGARAMFDGPASPITQTFGLGMFAETTARDLDRLETFFQERGAPVCHEVSPFAGVAVTDLLCQRGYRPIEFTSVMYRTITPADVLPRAANPRLETRQLVEGEEDLWSQISARGWAEQIEWRETLLSMGRVMAASEGALAFLVNLDGEPIATGVLWCHAGVALFGGACTVPEARKQGAQLALLEARMRVAESQGCDLAMMCAQPGSASQRNAERQGFRIAYTRIKWQLSSF